MPATRPQRPATGIALALPRVSDEDSQRAFDGVSAHARLLQARLDVVSASVSSLTASPERAAAEIAAGVTPVDFSFPVGCVDRYGVNTTPGATDMTAAATAAIRVVDAAGGGVVLWLGARYLVGSIGTFIAYTASAILHVGASREGTLILNGSADQPAISCGDGSTAIYGGGVIGMQFSQRSGVTAVNGNCAFLYSGVGQFAIRDVFVSNNIGAPFRGVVFTSGSIGCSQFVVNSLQVQGCIDVGITLINTVDSYITDCRSDANSAGWLLNGTQGVFAKSCTTFLNSGIGWSLQSANAAVAPNKNNSFMQCVGDTSGSYNWQIIDSQDSQWVDCWGGTQISTAVNTFAAGFIVVTDACKRLGFDACIAINNNAHGFQIFDDGTAPTFMTFSNCQFIDNGRSGVGYGFTSNGNVNSLRVASGVFRGNTTGPFLNTSALTDICVTGNPVGYVSANQGTGTITIGTSAVVITHGLGFTPILANIQVTDTSSRAASTINSVWISTPTATQFTVNCNAAVAGANFTFVWRAVSNGN